MRKMPFSVEYTGGIESGTSPIRSTVNDPTTMTTPARRSYPPDIAAIQRRRLISPLAELCANSREAHV